MTALPPLPFVQPGLATLQPGSKLYDLLFGLPLVAWYGLGFWTQLPLLARALSAIASPHSDPLLMIDALSKGAALLFAVVLIGLVLVRRPPFARAQGFVPKAIAFFGAFLGVAILSLPHGNIGVGLQLLSTAMILGGMGFAVYALLWLGRSISVMSEARQLVTGGPYSIVRHPLYLGEETALIGVTLQFLSPAAIAILFLQIVFQLHRMRIEEQVMSESFPEYRNYASRVKRLVPGLY